MAKAAKKAGASKREKADADVGSYVHRAAKRKNIPTAELQKLVPDDDKAIKQLRWPRNTDLDPQLVWRGKDIEADPLEVDAPPIYIQEKIQPRAIIEDLRRQTKERRADASLQIDFFHDFNGLADPEAKTEFYAHDQNWSNRMILGDSLLVMASLAEREGLRGKVQCIYIDPPYGIRFNSNWQPSTKSRDVNETSANSVSREPEVIRAFRDTWKDEINSYLSYLRDRLVVARDLLHDSGSVFVQIGDENVHLVRSLLDEIFGRANFISLIAFAKTTGLEATSRISASFDFILWYARSSENLKYRPIFRERTEASASRFALVQLLDGNAIAASEDQIRALQENNEWHRIFTDTDLTKPGPGAKYEFEYRGKRFTSDNRWWGTQHDSLRRIAKAHRLFVTGRDKLRFVDTITISSKTVRKVQTRKGRLLPSHRRLARSQITFVSDSFTSAHRMSRSNRL
jgi:adenine-specific DNA-methyltransferase